MVAGAAGRLATTSSTRTPKVLIVGGGIGGPVLAIALRRAGLEAVVYEAQPGPAGSRGLYTVRPGGRSEGEAWWFANLGSAREPSRAELDAVAAEEWKRRLRLLFEEDPAFIVELIDRTEEIGAFPIHDMPSLPAWHRGRAVLLGDAAHAVSPSAGQGASMAIEDALELARRLRDLPAPEPVLARYEARRRDRAERIVATGRRRGRYKAPRNRATLFLRDLLMPLAFRLFATERATSWIYDHEIAWEEPGA